MKKMRTIKPKNLAWVVAVDMGYGHLRPAENLRHLAYRGEVIVANSYPGIPEFDRALWANTRKFYEFVSRLTHVPILGRIIFAGFDKVQSIPPFYPRRDLSRPTIQVNQMYRLIKRKEWGKHLINKLSKKPLPLITTFFAVAFMAEEHGYPGPIYCVATDTDVSRAWVAKSPHVTKIRYFAPSQRVAERLKEYGVPERNIYFTGFPLPVENVDGPNLTTVRHDLAHRLVNLDPQRNYRESYWPLVTKKLKVNRLPKRSNHPLTITFSVGGAGAQRELGAVVLRSLKQKIIAHEMRLILVAGVHNSVSTYFREQIRHCGLLHELGAYVDIIFATNKQDYFQAFNLALRTTDILWTKPSELSFYTALGLPIVIAPPIGSQEVFNRKWLRTMGVAANQYQPQYAAEWLSDWVASGWCAEAAMQGFVEAPKFGTYNIEKVIRQKPKEAKKITMRLQY